MGTILFDLDNTLAGTQAIEHIRESGDYRGLNEEALAKVRAYKQVPELLADLRMQGHKLGLVTNAGAQYVERVLAHIKLDNSFNTIVTYSDVGRDGAKPAPVGLQIAMARLDVQPSPDVLFVGDDFVDVVAAYRAGVTPMVPSWASRAPVSLAPAIEASSDMLRAYFANPGEFCLFGERCAEHGTIEFPRELAYFLPLDLDGNVVTLRKQMRVFCLGRYFSQKTDITARMHDMHALSQHIFLKESQTPFQIPRYWTDAVARVVANGPGFLYEEIDAFDAVTVVPAKPGKDPRLERLLESVKEVLRKDKRNIDYIPDALSYKSGGRDMKTLRREERASEVRNALVLGAGAATVAGKRVLLIDDVITTSATFRRATELLFSAGAKDVVGLAIAKTVSLPEDEKSCPQCGRAMRLLKSAYGRFWGCSGYFVDAVKCPYKEPLDTKPCPRCERPMVQRLNSKTGELFWGCTGYKLSPACNYSESI